jgi:multicomponent Na+:H+ antiporter subunit D
MLEHLTEHLPALQVVVPLMAAPVCVLIRRPVLVRVWALFATWVTLAISLALVGIVSDGTVISYYEGSWAPPLGIELRLDQLNVFVLTIVTGIASVVMPFGLGSATVSIKPQRHYLFYAAFLLCIAGLCGITITGDAFNVFVFLEISSLSAYTLVSLGHTRRALRAAFTYLIMGTIGGTFLLLGIGFLYASTGTLNMVDIAARLQVVGMSRTVLVAFAFIVVGSLIKLAVFPLHQWLPNAYTHAPPVVTAFLAATATKVSFYVLIRALIGIFGFTLVFETLGFGTLLLPLSLTAMFIGSTAAIYQTDVKRLLAYSSIAQIGYMTLGLSLGNVDGFTGGIVHLFNHAVMKGGLFLVVACVVFAIGSSRVQDWAGLGKRMPVTSFAFVIGGFGLIGVPGTAGFVSKWYLVIGALEAGHLWLAGLILLSSLLAVVYVFRIIEIMYFRDPPADAKPVKAPTITMVLPTWLLILGTIWFGLSTSYPVGMARAAAEQLLGVGP